ncbi:LysR family transcriptional regulator [Colwellia echini]|uniref:LysR family transcriptional regulator n=1 Tax=Colwellia echini TaxID=1982103 RepID=A0ABY3MTM4_9GAMM|nr:LysR family transcriptional regulator [Colwellia echini]TYK64558.1 LysR family transcriptional regulator [Colwellia echini]
MRLSLEQLTAFCAVANEKSFSAAARKLGKSQSAISIAVANLEIDLAVNLFDRSGRYPTITNHGRSLLRDAEAILRQCSSMESRANSLESELESQLTIAIGDTIPFQLLNSLLSQFSEKFPFVDLNILHYSSSYIQQLIEQEKASLAVMCTGEHYPQDIHFKRLGNIAFANVVHKDHALAKLAHVNFDDLNQYRQLIYSPLQDKLPTSEYLNGTNQWHMESYFALMNTLCTGLGWATIPKELISELHLKDQIIELQLTSYPHTELMVGVDLLWSSSVRLGQAGSWLRDALSVTVIK